MKYVAPACGAIFAVLIVACGAAAQAGPEEPVAVSSTASGPFAVELGVPPALPSFAMADPTAGTMAAMAPASEPMAASQKDAPASGAGADVPPQGVYGVFPSYRYQVYAGYTFVRFYVIPNVEENTNGLNFSIAYYFRDSIAADGEAAVTFGSLSGENSRFFLGMGGARYRVPVGGADVWVHGLAGYAHLSPQTAYGGEDGFGYEVGGGVDVTPRHMRVSWRIEADMVGTHLFGTYQYSPKISFGVVYKD